MSALKPQSAKKFCEGDAAFDVRVAKYRRSSPYVELGEGYAGKNKPAGCVQDAPGGFVGHKGGRSALAVLRRLAGLLEAVL
ncbi:hypothetical protein, partial [Mycolicibacterium sp.]|uniref:hypothetical protein n=1 Tax=Mycolicibacterium sp. TaxID=2320850 RepID=UPI0037C7EA45